MTAGFFVIFLGLALIVIALLTQIGDNNDVGHRWKRINDTDYSCVFCGRVKREHCRDHRRACPVSWEILEEGAGPNCTGDE